MNNNRESILHGVNPMTMIEDCKDYETLVVRAEYLRKCADAVERYALRHERNNTRFMRHEPGSWVSWGDGEGRGVIKKAVPHVDRGKPGSVGWDYVVLADGEPITFTDPPEPGCYGSADLESGIR